MRVTATFISGLMLGRGGGRRIMRRLRRRFMIRLSNFVERSRGEHGIGYVKRRNLQRYADHKALELMRAIKGIFYSEYYIESR
jgi:FAD/FMN-containing dehydrogenase